ncbi:MAG: hypothetical protein ACJ798_05655 [Phenylobacterium sp.]
MRRLLIALLLIALAAPAQAQFLRRAPAGPVKPPPKDLPPAEAEIWPFPPPDPKAWWNDKRPVPAEAADPLGGRRMGRGERLVPLDNGVDPSTYRLWGLMPLQWQLLRGQEMILEVWVRPARSVRQSVVRVTVRRDGKAFVQARAGLACCEAEIARRMGFDAELPSSDAAKFLAMRSHPFWSQPRDVQVRQAANTADTVCISGTSYDLTLVVPGRSRSLRRACDAEAVGQAADILEAVLGAAIGHDTRFDAIYPGGASFASERSAYQELTQAGGALKAEPRSRVQPPGVAPAPDEAATTPPAAPATAAPSRPGSSGE